MGCGVSKNVSAESNTWVPAAKPIIFETSAEPDTVLIFLHGIAGQGAKFEDPLKALFAGRPGLRVVLPTSPATADRVVQAQMTSVVKDLSGEFAGKVFGAAVRATDAKLNNWFDDVDDLVTDEEFQRISDEGELAEFVFTTPLFEKSQDMKRAIAYVHGLIREQITSGIPAERIFVGGHSMGGFVATRVALSFPDAPLAGLLAVSTFANMTWPLQIAPAQSNLGMLKTHGIQDQAIPLAFAEAEAAELRKVLAAADKLEYVTFDNMRHNLGPEAFDLSYSGLKDPSHELGAKVLEFIKPA